MDPLGFILIAIVGAALGALGHVSFRRIRRSDIERRPIRRRTIVLLVLALIVIFLASVPTSHTPPGTPLSSTETETIVLVREHAGGKFTQYPPLPDPPPYAIAITNSSGDTNVIVGSMNSTPSYTTQIDLLPPNITVKEGPNEQVIPAENLVNVTIQSGFHSLNVSTFSEIRVVWPNLSTPSPSPTPTPSPQNWWQSLQDSISANLLAYTGYFASFIGVGYFARDITLRIKRLV